MNITSYREDGTTVLSVIKAIGKSPCGAGFLPDHFDIWMSDGKRITSSAAKFDAHYPGWRDLPEYTKPARGAA